MSPPTQTKNNNAKSGSKAYLTSLTRFFFFLLLQIQPNSATESKMLRIRLDILFLLLLNFALKQISSQDCFVTEFKSELRKKCVFPFILSDDNNQVRLENCTTILDPEGRAWCSTKVRKQIAFDVVVRRVRLLLPSIVCLPTDFCWLFNFKVYHACLHTYIRRIQPQRFKMATKTLIF